MGFSILLRSTRKKRAFVTETMSKTDRSAQGHGSGAGPLKRRRGSLRALSSSLPGVTKRVFARRGLMGAELARQWPAIVGSELAAQCRPRRLRFPRPGEALDGTLTLRVDPAWALEIQHLETPLLERINSFLGYRAVTRLVLQQGPLANRQIRPRPAAETHPGEPPAPDAALTAKLTTIADQDLRNALAGLGRSLQQKRAKKAGRP